MYHTFGVAVPHIDCRLAGHTNAKSKNAYRILVLVVGWVLGVGFAMGREFLGAGPPTALLGLFVLFLAIQSNNQTNN